MSNIFIATSSYGEIKAGDRFELVRGDVDYLLADDGYTVEVIIDKYSPDFVIAARGPRITFESEEMYVHG